MTLAEKVCGKGFLLAQLLGQRKGTGPSVLGLHSDYNLMREPFPLHSQACTAIWALEDFTLEAGPTMVIPGSHKLKRHPRRGENVESLKAIEMPKGSIALWDGATWHAQGDRSLPGERVTLHSTYSRMTLRTYDSYLHIAPEILARNPPELTTLCGLDDLFEKNTYAGPDFQRLRRAEALFRT
jgi:ectoine hydroxylase-related dioxygenase (phytanoyl-CoA dioxygenase family)